jgi:hypothetical protein
MNCIWFEGLHQSIDIQCSMLNFKTSIPLMTYSNYAQLNVSREMLKMIKYFVFKWSNFNVFYLLNKVLPALCNEDFFWIIYAR